MSYCRWSSNNFQCDLYCYEDASGGYTTHVARCRHAVLPEVSLEQILQEQDVEKLTALLKKYNEWGNEFKQELVVLGLPYDGQSFNDPDLESFLERVTMLRDAGYRVPDFVFAAIADEIKEDVENDS